MDKVQLLKELLEIYSPSGEEKRISDYLIKELNEFGFNTYCDEVGNVISKIGDGSPEIVFLGHIDTISGFIEVKEVDGKIYGRGSVDAKGPYAAFVSALYEIKDRLNKSVTVIGAVEEETESRGARYLADKYSPDFAINGEPSGWSGITLGYKGCLRFEYNIRKEKIHHSGKDLTAAEYGIKFWKEIENYCTDFSKDKKLFDALLPTLVSMNSYENDFEQNVVIGISIRLPLDFDIERFKGWLSSKRGDGELNFIIGDPAVKMRKNNKLISAFLKSIRNQGGSPVFKYKTGTTDMNIVAAKWGCPFMAYGPGNSLLDHTPNEHIIVEEYLKSIEVIKDVLMAL